MVARTAKVFNLRLSRADLALIRSVAAEQNTTMSAMVRDWIEPHLAKSRPQPAVTPNAAGVVRRSLNRSQEQSGEAAPPAGHAPP